MLSLSMIERAFARISPVWGVHRLHSKASLALAMQEARGFDAARIDRRTAGWNASSGDANSENSGALELVRRRSRDLCRNNEWAGGAKRKLAAHMVGTGVKPRPPRATKARVKAKASEIWSSFNETCDPAGRTTFYGIQAQLAGEVVESGAAFLRWHLRDPAEGLAVPLQCEVLEHEFLDIRKTEVLPGGNAVVQGVEHDPQGRRVAYWLFPVHPGEVSSLSRKRFLSERIPAKYIDHVFRVDRPGQVTGVPWFAPIALRLRDTADYEEAALVRKKIEACLTVLVRRSGSGARNLAQGAAQSTDGKGRRLEKVNPGIIAYLDEAEEISSFNPAPSDGYADHLDQQLLASAAGIGLTFEQFTGNLRHVNYSSIREGKLDFWQVLDQWQQFMLIPQVCTPAWRRVMRLAGPRAGVPADLGSIWNIPRRPWVDPLKDVKAEEIELKLGLESWVDKVSARGHDPEEQINEIEQYQPRLSALGTANKKQAATATQGEK